MRRSSLVRFAATAALASVATPPAQTTRAVSGGGAALQQAIDASSPGDVLQVRGDGGRYDAVVLGKGLTILCDPTVDVRGSNGPAVTIQNLPPGQTLRWRGGRLTENWQSFLTADVLQIGGCRGEIEIDGVLVETSSIFAGSTGVRDCAGPVLFRNIDIGDYVFNVSPMRVERSQAVLVQDSPRLQLLHVEDSALVLDNSHVPPRNASIGLTVTRSTVSLHDSSVVGGLMFSAAFARAGAELFSGELRLSGTASIGNYFNGGGNNGYREDPAVLSHGGRIVLGPAASLRTGLSNPISGPATLSSEQLPGLRSQGRQSGQPLTLDLTAEPGSLTAIFIDSPQPFGSAASQFGPL